VSSALDLADDMLGNPHGADDPEGDFADDGASANDENDLNDGGMDDGASGKSDGSEKAAPGPGNGHTSGGPRTRASPVSAVGLIHGGAS